MKLTMTTPAVVFALASVALVVGCGGAQRGDEGEAHSGPQRPTTQPTQPAVEELTGAVTTTRLHEVLGRSAGEFLSRVELEPEARGGAFVGWRIITLPPTQPSWLDIRRGDVVTAVNGLGVERPEDGQQIWELLRVASEIRIDLLRQNEHLTIRIPVVDAEDEEGDDEPPAEERRGPEE